MFFICTGRLIRFQKGNTSHAASDQINNGTGNISSHIALNSQTLPLRSGVCLKRISGLDLWSTPTSFLSNRGLLRVYVQQFREVKKQWIYLTSFDKFVDSLSEGSY